ncbi:hypothetical protein AQJ64_18225 [Streptomyces griseoruber]|uniref:Uncharacterized protein n=1 Tax=Streptomyces griseoruber TaxID=1943 RepID=A0A101SZA6_9ACTN|nr:hypothetical protein AQJ64_18225 [Streptomyces griseoruber]
MAAAAGVYAVLSVAWWVRDRADHNAAAHLDAVEIDPYHAIATARRTDIDRVAAAELLRTGLIRVDAGGRLSLTDEGADPARTPAHPVPAALLTPLRRSGPRQPCTCCTGTWITAT